ncbi:MAG: TCP-1/cpn60 chaperonin family protein [Candidatus Heimdallarchaeota archaeon]|nr:TCP-1/cpn60 chaperonin family protein [Candidatus Heimdallarchaeota archaeon]MCK4955295.1 TCP-1/cpn60 chaperonin family protein [Candidatus Heimdallarchaeota archaeon]
MIGQGQVPVIILKEGTQRSKGQDAQKNNIMAAGIVADTIKSTLGPKGMDKMLVDSLGDILISNDGATLLDEIDVQHPAAKMIVQVAKAQDMETGDGTTSSVVITGELLKKGADLLDKKIHASLIVEGYKAASKKAQEILENLAKTLEPFQEDNNLLFQIAITSLHSKSVHAAKELMAKIAVDSVKKVADIEEDTYVVDLDNIKILQKTGKSLVDSKLIEGVIVDKEVVHTSMPKTVKDAKILLLNQNIEVQKGEWDREIRINDPLEMKSFLDNEEQILQEMVDQIVASGANVVVCQKGIDDMAQYFMAKENILAIRRVKKSDMEKLTRATGGKIVTNLKDASAEDLGSAGVVEEIKIADDDHVFIRKCKNPKSVSIILYGATKYVTDEAERSLHDALSVVRNVVEDKTYLPGGGAIFTELSLKINEFADEFKDKRQLAVKSFADALLSIPSTLAENAGIDPLDILNELRAAHAEGKAYHGIDLFQNGKITDMLEVGIIEPLRVVSQAIKSASESSILILRIDDVIIARSERPAMPPGGMPPGMGGMGGMPPGMM